MPSRHGEQLRYIAVAALAEWTMVVPLGTRSAYATGKFYETHFDASKWDEITVPSAWELEGEKKRPAGQPNYGMPIYTYSTYPFAMHPPRVMDDPPKNWTSYSQRNPVGSYLTDFEVPANWKGGRTVLHFAGVRSAMYVWVNGQKVGLAGSCRVRHYGFFHPGSNRLAVGVYRFSSASYMEDQDMWRLSGIFRDVFLYHPRLFVMGLLCGSGSDNVYRDATVKLHYSLRNAACTTATQGLRVRVNLPFGLLTGRLSGVSL
jgi:beta-galactosidase